MFWFLRTEKLIGRDTEFTHEIFTFLFAKRAAGCSRKNPLHQSRRACIILVYIIIGNLCQIKLSNTK